MKEYFDDEDALYDSSYSLDSILKEEDVDEDSLDLSDLDNYVPDNLDLSAYKNFVDEDSLDLSDLDAYIPDSDVSTREDADEDMSLGSAAYPIGEALSDFGNAALGLGHGITRGGSGVLGSAIATPFVKAANMLSSEKSPEQINKELSEQGFKLPLEEQLSTYQALKKGYDSTVEDLSKDSKAFNVGDFAGKGLSSVALAKAIPFLKAKEGAGFLVHGLKSGVAGTGLGFTEGVIKSDKEELAGVLEDATVGGFWEGMLSFVTGGVAGKLGDWMGGFKNVARDQAAKSIGIGGAEAKRLVLDEAKKAAKELSDAVLESKSVSKIQSVGQTVIDEKIGGPFKKAKDMLIQTLRSKDSAGKTIQKTIKKLDDTGEITFDVQKLKDALVSKLQAKYSTNSSKHLRPAYNAAIKDVDAVIEGANGGNISFASAQNLKQTIGQGTWDANGKLHAGRNAGAEVYHIINDMFDESLDQVAKMKGLGDDVLKEFLKAKSLYHNTSIIERALIKEAGKEFTQPLLSWSDYLLGGVDISLFATKRIASAAGIPNVLSATAQVASKLPTEKIGTGIRAMVPGVAPKVAELFSDVSEKSQKPQNSLPQSHKKFVHLTENPNGVELLLQSAKDNPRYKALVQPLTRIAQSSLLKRSLLFGMYQQPSFRDFLRSVYREDEDME